MQHRFEYTYVWSYSSTELPLHLLIACFYSGQEGSFLLWTLLVAAIGVFLLQYSKKRGYEQHVMVVYGAILCFLTLLLVAKNPFLFYWESFASQGILPADVPLQGKGLNPLLHNAWITIHPPILFTGFASMTVSFAFAMAGLMRKEYQQWINVALPWTLFGTAILGFGIMLGGFWAYETLGWGGFWGWDPVENSSLIPWLVSVALVHTMLIQRRTRGLVKTNMVLAVSAFVMVLYSTFLTRSGILGDTSVHSFVDPGNFAFWILLLFMATFSIAGISLLLIRRKDMDVNREEFSSTTREFTTAIGAALIMASAIFVTVGTSWPVIMEIMGLPKVAVATDYYNNVHMYLIPFVLILNAISIAFQWRKTNFSVFKKRYLVGAGVAIVGTAVTYAYGIQEVGFLALAFGAWLSLAVNAATGFRIVTSSPTSAGAYISHTGFALLIMGVITTSSYTVHHHAVLVQGKPVQVGEYVLTYEGKEQIEKHFTDREKFKYHVNIAKDGSSKTVSAVLYWSDYNKRQSAFLEPGIRWGFLNDLYVSPKATGVEDVGETITVQRGVSNKLPYDTSVVVTIERFTMPMEEGPGPNGEIQIGAVINVQTANGAAVEQVKTVTQITNSDAGMEFIPGWVSIPGTSVIVGVTKIVRNNADPSKSTADLTFRKTSDQSAAPRETFTIDFSVKPLISLVWIGVITMVAGFFFSIVRLIRNSKSTTTNRVD
ncbi:MAG: cytochrome c biogenesis protein CcsA [Ignavibacteria bacterium]|nr:cytochrome c biogenesis protein CcsA [Ignavibacteria bacterium]